MLNSIVRTSVAHPCIAVAISILIAVLGIAALFEARFDVFPNFAPPHVTVQTEAPGLDALQVEALVTRPLESLLLGTEGVASVRSKSIQGLSVVSVVFKRGGDPYRQRQVVTERLADASGLLPPGAGPPRLSPLTSSMQYLLYFGYTSDTLSPTALRSLIRWVVQPQLLAVPGVAQAALFGGDMKERQVVVNPTRLSAYDLTLGNVVDATGRATELIGGGFVETPSQRIVIQSQAPGATPQALAQAVLTTRDGLPVRIGDVASVRNGTVPRFGNAIIGDQPGILVETATQYGANTLTVTRALEKRLDQLAPALKKQGVTYHPALLRPASFVITSLRNLSEALLIGAALVVIVLLLMLRDWRGAFISFASIPLSLLGTVLIVETWGLSMNTMSIGGLVVALGIVVDDAVIDVENIVRRRRNAGIDGDLDLRQIFVDASLEVRVPMLYATAAVMVTFVPIYLLSGVQGAFFRPLAVTFLTAVGLSLLVAVSNTPALCVLLMRRHQPLPEARFLQRCKRLQGELIKRLYPHPRTVVAILVLSGVIGAALLPLFGQRLLPEFRENYLIAHATLRSGVSLQAATHLGEQITRRLMAIPGIATVSEQIGRTQDGLDADLPNKSEFEIQIAPDKSGSLEQVIGQIRGTFADFPSQLTEIYSVLSERIGETLSGEIAPFFVSVFGNDLDTDDAVAQRVVKILQKLPNSSGVRLQVPPRQPGLRITLEPHRLELYGLRADDVLRTINAAYQGYIVSHINHADRSIPVSVRLRADSYTPQAVGDLLLHGSGGALVPLAKVAYVEIVPSRSLIEHDGGLRRQVVVATPRGTDQAGYAAAARAAIAAQLKLPVGVYLRYGGAAVEQATAARQLMLHTLVAVVLIILLLAMAFGRARHVVLVLLALPSTLIGGVIATALTGATLTLGAMVGFVALFGIAARNTMLLISHYDFLVRHEACEWNLQTALRGAAERLTPVLLTALMAALGLLPVAIHLHEPGHTIDGPMAVVLLGGLVSSTLVSLILIPPLAACWLRPQQPAETMRAPTASDRSV